MAHTLTHNHTAESGFWLQWGQSDLLFFNYTGLFRDLLLTCMSESFYKSMGHVVQRYSKSPKLRQPHTGTAAKTTPIFHPWSQRRWWNTSQLKLWTRDWDAGTHIVSYSTILWKACTCNCNMPCLIVCQAVSCKNRLGITIRTLSSMSADLKYLSWSSIVHFWVSVASPHTLQPHMMHEN